MTFISLILLPIGLGLFGFVEPCTVGSHMIFLSTQETRTKRDRVASLGLFVVVRVLVMGIFGAAIVYLGQALIGVQTGLWLVFGSIYILVGAAFLLGIGRLFRRKVSLAPSVWARAQHPALLGMAFGLNIPACAAPLLFGLLGVAIGGGSALMGFVMMGLFAFALSAPLIPILIWPKLSLPLSRLTDWLRPRGWLIGVVFLALGAWSVWFGLFVDPVDWSGQ